MNTSFFGRLTKDPEVKFSSNGNTFASFTVASQVRARDNEGKNKSTFVNVTAFGKQGEIISQYFHKGSRIVVHGEVMDINAWTGTNDNQPHAGISVSMSDFDFIDTKAESQAQGYQQPQRPQGGYAAQPPVPPQARPQAPIPPQGYAAPQAPVPPQQPQQQAPWAATPQQPPVPPQAPAPQQQNYQNTPY